MDLIIDFFREIYRRNLIQYYIYVIKYTISRQLDGMSILGQIFLLFGEALLLFVAWILFLKKKNMPIRRIIHYYLLLAYTGFLVSVTILRRPFGSRERQINLYIDFGYGNGRSDFWLWWSCIITILNVMLFVPWGMIIGTFFYEKSVVKRVAITTLIGFLTSLIVESVQLITGTGFFELTDLVTNTFGTFLGSLIIIKKLR